MRLIYTFCFTLLTPFILLRLFWRGFKAPAYRMRWRERLGLYNFQGTQNCLWFHAVSVGEAEALFPLIKLWQKHHPEQAILITTTTPTGSKRVKNVLADSVEHVYLPYDLPFITKRFLNHFQPKLAAIMEKEIWPNLFSQCANKGIPLFIINARLATKSAKNYQKIPLLVLPALNAVNAVFTQTTEDSQNFIDLGIPSEKVIVLGNMKFDVDITPELIEQGHRLKQNMFKNRFVLIAASTHDGEENILLNIYQKLKPSIPELLLLIAPRHPERFFTVKSLAETKHLTTVMRSHGTDVTIDTDIYIADTMGELKMLYTAADISFVGGSLIPIGGHNILEPLAVGTPVIFGKYMVNFKEITHNVLACKAGIQANTEQEIIIAIQQLHTSHTFRQSLIDNGKQFMKQNLGVTQRILTKLENYAHN